MTDKQQDFRFDSMDIVMYIWKRRVPLFIITFAAGIISIIGSLMITPKFNSTVVLFPTSEASVGKVNGAFKEAAEGTLKGILGLSMEPLVSVDYKGDPRSSIIDGLSTLASGKMVKVLCWYDNEWGYACRLADLVNYIRGKM